MLNHFWRVFGPTPQPATISVPGTPDNTVIQLTAKRLQAWGSMLSDVLMIAFLALTLYHTQHILSEFEDADVKFLAWALATGIDVGIAFAAFSVNDKNLPGSTRWFAGLWLAGLLFLSYGLNVAYYTIHQDSAWTWLLAATFPASLAFLGFMKPGLSRYASEQTRQAEIDELTKIVEGKYQEIVEPVEQKLTEAEKKHAEELAALQGQLELTNKQLQAPDPQKLALESQLNEARAQIDAAHRQLEQERNEARQLQAGQAATGQEWQSRYQELQRERDQAESNQQKLEQQLAEQRQQIEKLRAEVKQQQQASNNKPAYPADKVSDIISQLYKAPPARIGKDGAVEMIGQLWQQTIAAPGAPTNGHTGNSNGNGHSNTNPLDLTPALYRNGSGNGNGNGHNAGGGRA